MAGKAMTSDKSCRPLTAALSGSFCVLIFLLIVADLHSDTFVNLKLSRRRREDATRWGTNGLPTTPAPSGVARLPARDEL